MKLIKQAAVDKQKIYFSVVTECELISGLASEDEIRNISFHKERSISGGNLDEISQSGNYEAMEPEEEMLLLDANADNPSLPPFRM